MAVADQLFEQALTLSDEERRKLTARLLKTLPEEPDGDLLSDEEWQEAWHAELLRRDRDIEDGTAELIDGETVMAEMLALAHAPRP